MGDAARSQEIPRGDYIRGKFPLTSPGASTWMTASRGGEDKMLDLLEWKFWLWCSEVGGVVHSSHSIIEFEILLGYDIIMSLMSSPISHPQGHSDPRSGSGKAALYPPGAGGRRVSKYSFSCKVERKNSVSHVVSASIRWHILMITHLWVMLQCNAAVGLITADLESAARSIGPGARLWTWWE